MVKRAWFAAFLVSCAATGAAAQDCTCDKYPFGSASSCVEICGAKLLNTAPFADIFSVLKLPDEAQNEILADETTPDDPNSLSHYSQETQDAIANGLASADPDALKKLLSEE